MFYLSVKEVFKVPAGLERTIVNSLVLVTYRCSKHLLVGDRLVFFGKVTQVNPFIMALDDCSPTGHLPECDMSNLRTKDFSNQCGEIAHSCRCEKNHGPGTVWQTGIFDCYTCSCSDDSTCTTSCSFHYTCAVIPTVGLGVILSILLLFGLLCCIWSKKRTSKDAELEEPLVPMEVNHVAINTQPVVMMSQTGEPLLVKVAYVQ